MSQLIVEVCQIEEIAVHPAADRLERVRVKNWWCIAPKGRYQVGDKVVYLPPDSIISEELANRWGIAKYCQAVERGFRIRAARFRTVPSFGCIQDLDDPSWVVGQDLCEHYGILKYEPPPHVFGGDNERPHPAFHIYTDIENFGHFTDMFQDGEEVVVEEKIHGCVGRDTRVMLPNGEQIPIHEVKEGDFVLSLKEEQFVATRVKRVIVQPPAKKWVRLTFDDGKQLVCTNDHPILTAKGWKKAKDITENDVIRTI